jgi:hypothetical protein
MNEIEHSRLTRFKESPWAIWLAGAGLLGGGMLLGMGLLRMRSRSRLQANRIKKVVRESKTHNDPHAGFVETAQSLEHLVGAEDVADVVVGLVSNEDSPLHAVPAKRLPKSRRQS